MTDKPTATDDLNSKVSFRLERGDDGYPPADWEHLWATRLPDGTFELDNTPFFAVGVSYLDVVATVRGDGMNVFRSVVRASGHSTLRVILFDTAVLQTVRTALRELGCSTELSHLPNLIAVDIPPNVELNRVRQYLSKGELDGQWEYEESALQH